MLVPFLLAAVAQTSSSPLDFARAEITQAVGARSSDVTVEVRRSNSPESYTIEPRNGKVRIVGSDSTGAMYGAFEFAERLRNHGEKAWTEPAKAEPYLAQRGVNLFLTLPWDYKKNDTDDSIEALTDPRRWWFQDEHYWTTLLDLMAHSRLNWLDIHGSWDISVTDAPNLYAYFVTSPSFPKVGVPDDVKAKDLAQLNHVIEMAHARGIKVSLMSYEARFHTPQNPNPPYKATEENLYKYTREVVEQMIRKTPKLDAIGFRIGESGHGASFFKCYTEAVKNSGRDIPLITRTWVTTKPQVLALARTSKDFTAEIKYNGEQWGAPYIVVGGRMANWGSYSYEDYLSDSGPGRAAKLWPGNPTDEGGRWPSEPYKIVWQVRANGTHRIFPFYNPDWTRRSIKCMKMGTVSGYTVEGEDAYFPKSPLYYLANPADQYCDFIHQRDELYWMCWGRLGYDPNTPDSTFDAEVSRWFGDQGPRIAEAWKAASTIVPLAYMAHALGPDHRDHAPELEAGDGGGDFDEVQPLDPFVCSPNNQPWTDGRLSPAAVADRLQQAAGQVGRNLPDESAVPAESRPRLAALRAALTMEVDLARYYAARLGAESRRGWLEGAGQPASALSLETVASIREWWANLCYSPEADYFRPFTDRLRMHTNSYHWRLQIGRLPAIASAGPAIPVADARGYEVERMLDRLPAPAAELKWSAAGERVEVTLPREVERTAPQAQAGQPGATPGNFSRTIRSARLLYKPLPSSTFFHSTPMSASGAGWAASLDRPKCGLAIAAELDMGDGSRWRLPSFAAGQTPYLVVPARSGPTPMIYNSDEALSHLDPAILTPDNFGPIIVGSRAAKFFGQQRAQKRKLVQGVKQGMKLLILQQDFAGRRYQLDFLPKPLKVEANPNPRDFDPGGQLGMSAVHSDGIQWQRFVPSDGWDVFGSGGLARLKLGAGEVWVTSARFMQRATDPNVAGDLKRLLKAFVTSKPAILVDAGTESAVYTTSFWPDLMNDQDMPFLTLGEAIAQEQGISSTAVIAGPAEDDDVLGGKGSAQATAFLKAQVVAASRRPTPPTVAEFETLRKQRRHELMRALGLDPMPPRTALHPRITGRIQRDGFYIE